MEISDIVKKYTPLGKKYGSVNENTDNGIYFKTIELGDIKLVYSSCRDGEEDLDTFYNEADNADLPKYVREELIKDIAQYLLNH